MTRRVVATPSASHLASHLAIPAVLRQLRLVQAGEVAPPPRAAPVRPFALPALALGTAHVRYAPAVGRVVVRGRGRQLQVEGASLLATRVCTLAGWAGWPRTLQPHVHVRCAPPEPLGAPCEPCELIPRHSVRDEETAQITNLHKLQIHTIMFRSVCQPRNRQLF